MFTGNFREATALEQEVLDVSADAFEEFLYFIYAGDLRNKDFPVEELIAIADRYQVSDLMRFCELKLLKCINDDNAEKIFRLANRINPSSPELKKISFEVMQS
jgi:BTB/POZ domain